jgi:hypothetical protein
MSKALLKIGVAWLDFDDAHDSSGWASVEGDKPFRFDSPTALPTNIIWASNKKYNTQINAMSFITKGNYFRSQFQMILKDLGIEDDASIFDKLPRLSALTGDAYQLMLRFDEQRDKHFNAGATQSFMRLYRNNAAEKKQISNYPQGFLAALENATQKQVAIKLAGVSNFLKSITLKRNRYGYAKEMLLNVQYPNGTWTLHDRYEFGDEPIDRLYTLLSMDLPYIAEATIKDLSSQKAILLAIRGGANQRDIRNYFLPQDIMMLHDAGADIEIGNVYVCLGGYKHIPLHKDIESFFNEPLFNLSYAAGLVAEDLLEALTSPYVESVNRIRVQTHLPISSFIQATDRFIGYKMAEKLVEVNPSFNIQSYGKGGVSLGHDGQLQSIFQLDAFVRESSIPFPVKIAPK